MGSNVFKHVRMLAHLVPLIMDDQVFPRRASSRGLSTAPRTVARRGPELWRSLITTVALGRDWTRCPATRRGANSHVTQSRAARSRSDNHAVSAAATDLDGGAGTPSQMPPAHGATSRRSTCRGTRACEPCRRELVTASDGSSTNQEAEHTACSGADERGCEAEHAVCSGMGAKQGTQSHSRSSQAACITRRGGRGPARRIVQLNAWENGPK